MSSNDTIIEYKDEAMQGIEYEFVTQELWAIKTRRKKKPYAHIDTAFA